MIKILNLSQQLWIVLRVNSKALLIIGVLFAILLNSQFANAANIYNRYIKLSSSLPSATNVQYTAGFVMPSAQLLGSIAIEVCDNSPLEIVACNPPAGFSWSGATLASQSGAVGFTIDITNSTANKLVLTRLPSPIGANQNQEFVINGVVNPSNTGTYFAKIFSYNSTDATGPKNDFGAMAMSINNPISVATEVPPYLYFCTAINISGFDCSNTTGSYIDLGEFNKTGTVGATSQMVAATNADFGYNITVSGNSPTSGNNVIPGFNLPSSPTPGSSKFGINLKGNSNPSIGGDVSGGGIAQPTGGYEIPNKYKFVSGDTVATTADVSLENKFTVSYIVNVSPDQKPGIYTATLIYNILATF